MTMSATQLLPIFLALVTLFSPPAAVGPLAALYSAFDRPDQRRIALATFRNCAVGLLVFVWTGGLLFEVLGVTTDGLRFTSGMAVVAAGFPMMVRGRKSIAGYDGDGAPNSWREVVVVPMTFPMSIGPATAAYIVSASAPAQNALDLLAISGVVLGAAGVIYLTHLFAPLIFRVLGEAGRDLLTAVGGIVLTTIGVSLIAESVLNFFPGLQT